MCQGEVELRGTYRGEPGAMYRWRESSDIGKLILAFLVLRNSGTLWKGEKKEWGGSKERGERDERRKRSGMKCLKTELN